MKLKKSKFVLDIESYDPNNMYPHVIRIDLFPKFRILEKSVDSITRKLWIKLHTNFYMNNLIVKSGKLNENYQHIQEPSGHDFYWVTEKYMTMLMIKGARVEKD